MDNDNAIAYWVGSVNEFLDPNPLYRWITFHAFGNEIEDHQAGMVQLKITCNALATNGPMNLKDFESWKRPPPRRLGSYKLRCYIFKVEGITV